MKELKNNSNRKTRKRPGNYSFYGLDFDINDYIDIHKERIDESSKDDKQTSLKKEIILMVYTHGNDLPEKKLDTEDTKGVRSCVAGPTGQLFMQSGIYKDKILDAFYEHRIHEKKIKTRKEIVENIIKLHSAEYIKLNMFARPKETIKRYYSSYKPNNENFFEKDGLKSWLNYHVKHIKPVVDHEYSYEDVDLTTNKNRKPNMIDPSKFGLFTVVSSSVEEDQPHTIFGECIENGKIDYTKISRNKFDLLNSPYWYTKIGRPYKGYVLRRGSSIILLSDVLKKLKLKYENIYIVDISCRDLSIYKKSLKNKNPNISEEEIMQILLQHREKIGNNEISKGTYSPSKSSENRRAEES